MALVDLFLDVTPFSKLFVSNERGIYVYNSGMKRMSTSFCDLSLEQWSETPFFAALNVCLSGEINLTLA